MLILSSWNFSSSSSSLSFSYCENLLAILKFVPDLISLSFPKSCDSCKMSLSVLLSLGTFNGDWLVALSTLTFSIIENLSVDRISSSLTLFLFNLLTSFLMGNFLT
ncbi:MAG: hypothetical protein Ta2E_11480 [Mycoplasmoidaceae bacterium]|nr:MAG: hypothetical protein Ta2E_11480 [Mycoplasmoidaceae bacterium]